MFLVCNREDALYSLMENLQVYAEQAKVAKSLDADIIVFPEVPNLKHWYSNKGFIYVAQNKYYYIRIW